ncbi:MAG: hypothetical protein AAF610_15215 [Pseudomonadota bacterium]
MFVLRSMKRPLTVFLAILTLGNAVTASACCAEIREPIESRVEKALGYFDVVLYGRPASDRKSGPGQDDFRVERVWKGIVPPTIKLLGFQHTLMDERGGLVFASRSSIPGAYRAPMCGVLERDSETVADAIALLGPSRGPFIELPVITICGVVGVSLLCSAALGAMSYSLVRWFSRPSIASDAAAIWQVRC